MDHDNFNYSIHFFNLFHSKFFNNLLNLLLFVYIFFLFSFYGLVFHKMKSHLISSLNFKNIIYLHLFFIDYCLKKLNEAIP